MPMSQEGYYERLGLTKDAEPGQIKDAYRKLAFQYHPDRNPGDEACAEKMKAINEAYAVLSNAEKRTEYDRMRTMFGSQAHDRFRNTYSTEDIFRGTDINDIFEAFSRMFAEQNASSGANGGSHSFYRVFGGNAGGSDRKIGNVMLRYFMGKFVPMQGDDAHDVIWVNDSLARSGGPYAYESIWHGKKLVVHIPKNIRDGQSMRLGGMGKPGKNGGPNGDLLLKLRIRKSGATMLNELKDTAKSKVKKFFQGKNNRTH